jgi:peptidyl-prolyl cis-trans isomerase C
MPALSRASARRSTPIAALTVAAFALAAACTACSGCKSSSSSAGSVEAGAAVGPEGLTPEQAAQVLAKVGDRTITLGEFAAAIEQMDQFDRMRYQAPERRKELLNEMIDTMLLADEAREHGYDKDPQTQQEIRQALRDALIKKERQSVPAPNDIPAEEVSAYFDAHKSDFHDPERRRVSAIVVASPAAAAGVLSSLKGPGAVHWGEIVRSKSIDPQAKANVPIDLAGDLGFVSPPGDARGDNSRIPPEVRSAAFDIDGPGGLYPTPVASGGRFYVVRLTGKTPPHDRSLPDVERTIRVKLSQEKIRAMEGTLVEQLQKHYPVRFADGGVESVKVDLPTSMSTPAVDAGPGPR